MAKSNLNDVKSHAYLSEAEREIKADLRKIKAEQTTVESVSAKAKTTAKEAEKILNKS